MKVHKRVPPCLILSDRENLPKKVKVAGKMSERSQQQQVENKSMRNAEMWKHVPAIPPKNQHFVWWDQWFLKCGPPTSRVSVTWELFRNAEFQGPISDSLNQKCWVWSPETCVFNQSSRGFWSMLGFENPWDGGYCGGGVVWDEATVS